MAMTLLYEAIEEKKFDVRTLEKRARRNLLENSDIERHTKQLPDDGSHSTWVNPDLLGDDSGNDRL